MMFTGIVIWSLCVVAASAVRTEVVGMLSAFLDDLYQPSSEIVSEIKQNLPHSSLSEDDVDRLRDHVIAATTVPAWLHHGLVTNAKRERKPMSFDDPDLIEVVLSYAPEGMWTSTEQVKFVVHQWIRYCVDPLVFNPTYRIKACHPIDGGRFWTLHEEVWRDMVMGMRTEAIDRLLGFPNSRKVDILEY